MPEDTVADVRVRDGISPGIIGAAVDGARHHLELRLRLLQQWRALHALAEGSHRFSIPHAQEANLAHLRKYFPVDLVVGDDTPAPPLIRLNTDEPWCEVAGIRRTLVFPHSQLERCRAMWPTRRSIRFGFAGMDHRERGDTLDQWHRAAFGRPSAPVRLRRGEELPTTSGEDGVAIVYSKQGRSFPVKVWDEAYYEFAAHSEFTLCPDGEEVWTYRFFEAMICGSIPVVQSDCAAYSGFRYRFLADTGPDARISLGDVRHNFDLCHERLTIPRADLDAAVARVLDG